MRKLNKKILFIILILIGNLFYISCQETKKSSDKIEESQIEKLKKMNINIEEIKKHIELQKNIETDEYEPKNPYEYSEKDLKLGFDVIYLGLLNNGFKDISNTVFNERMENIFNYKRTNGDKCSHNWYYVQDKSYNYILYGLSYRLDDEIVEAENIKFGAYVDVENFFFNKDKHFMTDLPYLKDLIQINPDNSYKISLPQELVNRNKYLFNESKASFAWLKANDEFFLESLVKTFGYMNDKDLLQWAIDRTLSDKNNKGEDYNSLFFMKDCSNKYIFHKETFEVLKENITNKTLEALESYILDREKNKGLQALSFEQKAQVLAYVLYTGEYFAQQEKYSSRFMFKFMGTFYEFDKEGDKYDEEFKKNNYYNIPDFKQLWEQAKEEGDGIGLPM